MTTGGRIGDITYDRIIETEGPEFDAGFLIPQATDEALAPLREWLEPWALDPATGKLVMTTQSYLVRTRHHTILIDACVGNDKERRFNKDWAFRTSTAYLDRLAAAGVRPEEIDFVMCTHMHSDHVGWNTRLVDGRWVPTFPNARYVFSKVEWDYFSELNKKGKKYTDGCMDDSVLPVVEAGQAEIVAADHALDDEVWLEPWHGHTPGHTGIRLRSKGTDAIMCGDAIHHPIHCARPEWYTAGDIDRDAASATRRRFLEAYADTGTLVMTAHFPSPSSGRIISGPDRFDFEFAPE